MIIIIILVAYLIGFVLSLFLLAAYNKVVGCNVKYRTLPKFYKEEMCLISMAFPLVLPVIILVIIGIFSIAMFEKMLGD